MPAPNAVKEALAEIHQAIEKCQLCPLAQGRKKAVPGEGPINAAVMFIGEGPGEQEDRQGKPFVGNAGKFLNELLAIAGLERQEVFITNVVKCRPPDNRSPTAEEVAACRGYLEAQIALIQPRMICLLGSVALKAVLPEVKGSVSQVHGQVFHKNGIVFIPLFHPAAALHQARWKDVLRQDMLKVKSVLSQLEEASLTSRA
ncbi:MAG: uracil-DNA glycosylase [Armatimonadetes bacterium]|nr:uracil-DNA glycosylase [Armatimonadota bacterium]MDW8122531.1 uracil-DNA glycosylase [Armatimonadota bacterium]